MSTLTYLLTCSAATVWFVVLKIVNVLIMTRTNLSRVKERTHMTAPDEKTLTTLTRLFEEEFGPIGDRQVLYVHAPGRSEISGNHTDHEGGHVIAGSLDVAVDGIAVATDSNKVRVADEGYPTFEITLDTLDVQESEKGTSASLVRGMAHEVAALGVEPQGLRLCLYLLRPFGRRSFEFCCCRGGIRPRHGNPLGLTRN